MDFPRNDTTSIEKNCRLALAPKALLVVATMFLSYRIASRFRGIRTSREGSSATRRFGSLRQHDGETSWREAQSLSKGALPGSTMRTYTSRRKRSLMKTVAKAAAVACALPRYTSDRCHGVTAIPHDSLGIGNDGTRRQHSYRTGPQTPESSVSADSHSKASPLQTLRTLASRWKEPVPLRASKEAATSTTTVEARRRLAELADELVKGYNDLPPMSAIDREDSNENKECQRSEILACLATECGPDDKEVASAINDYTKHQDEVTIEPRRFSNDCQRLRQAATPLYEELLNFVLQQNAVDGMEFLVALREDLLFLLRNQTEGSSDEASKATQQRYRDLDDCLKSIFSRWFVPGLLRHERITYESTPAAVIEAIATREAVHPMRSLEDLKERLGPSKRVFCLFHPCLPDRPLVFVHAALLRKLPYSMDDIHKSSSSSDERPPTVAAFYSISNGVKGLSGVGLGEYLLKESIRALQTELPSLDTFVTLSPLPRFRKWIEVTLLREDQQHKLNQDAEASSSLLSVEDCEALHRCGLISSATTGSGRELLRVLAETDFQQLLRDAQEDVYDFLSKRNDGTNGREKEDAGEPGKLDRVKQLRVLREILLRLASSYLAVEKHRGRPLDRVCGFHVGNGAELYTVRFGADLSRSGLAHSYGVMAVYRYYDPATVAANQATFESSGFVVPVGPGVRRWLDRRNREATRPAGDDP